MSALITLDEAVYLAGKINDKIEDVQADVTTNAANISSAQTAILSNTNRIAALEEGGAVAEDVEQLKTDVSALKGDVEDLQEADTEIRQTITDTIAESIATMAEFLTVLNGGD